MMICLACQGLGFQGFMPRPCPECAGRGIVLASGDVQPEWLPSLLSGPTYDPLAPVQAETECETEGGEI